VPRVGHQQSPAISRPTVFHKKAPIAAGPNGGDVTGGWQVRHNPAVLESWNYLIDEVGPRPGMWVGRDKYSLVRSFVQGFGTATDDDVLDGFQQWLSRQPQHRAIRNFAWSSLLLHEVFPERDRVVRLSWQEDPATANPSWPVPAPSPVSEDDLVYPEDDKRAIVHLFARLREYLDSRPTLGDSQ
jgi:hypothetical protein